MTDVLTSSQGGYRFIKGVFRYSAGVAAEPGFEIVRARFAKVLPLAEGFARIERHLSAIGRLVSAFCACELRPSRSTMTGSATSTGAMWSRCEVGILSTMASTRLKFPDPRFSIPAVSNNFPVNYRRKMLKKSPQHGGFSLEKRMLKGQKSQNSLYFSLLPGNSSGRPVRT